MDQEMDPSELKKNGKKQQNPVLSLKLVLGGCNRSSSWIDLAIAISTDIDSALKYRKWQQLTKNSERESMSTFHILIYHQ